jgi:hypothetical protein
MHIYLLDFGMLSINAVMMWRRFTTWLREHLPAMCIMCGRVMFAKNAHWERAFTNETVPLCSHCYKKVFEPFGEEQ